MRAIMPLSVVADLAAIAAAQTDPEVVFRVEASNNGVNFGDAIATTPGSTVDLRVLISRSSTADRGSATYHVRADWLGLAQAPTVGDILRLLPFRFGLQILASFEPSSSLRIDDSRDSAHWTNLDINSIRQTAPDLPPEPVNPAVVLRLRMQMPFDAGLVHVTVSIAQVRGGVVQLLDVGPFPYGPRDTSHFAADGASIYVGGNPCFGQQISTPESQRVIAGSNVVFTASGDGAPYQWSRNGVELLESAKFVGVESDMMAISNVTLADAGDYRIRAICSTSDPACLEVFCRADFNNDGFTDFFDFDDFVAGFESGAC